jgi:hypothetical protein
MPQHRVALVKPLNSTGPVKSAFDMLRAGATAEAGVKRKAGATGLSTSAKPAASVKKVRVLSPEQQALFDLIPREAPSRKVFKLDEKRTGVFTADTPRFHHGIMSTCFSFAVWDFYQSCPPDQPGGKPNKTMAVEFIRQIPGFEKFARQDLRNWERKIEENAKKRRREDLSKSGATDGIGARDVASGEAAFPVLIKRGRKVNTLFEAVVITKLTYLTVVNASDSARAKAKTRLKPADRLNVDKVKLAEQGAYNACTYRDH